MKSKRLSDCFNIADLRKLAQRRAHKMVFDYIDGGADDEKTLKNNCTAFESYRLMYRVLSGVESIDPSTTLLGTKMVSAICVERSWIGERNDFTGSGSWL